LGVPGFAPATIQGEKESKINRAHESPGRRICALARVPSSLFEKESNIQRSVNGIVLANAKPRRPRKTVCAGAFADNAKEMLIIHPAIARAESPKRRLTAACRL
jgi:hypothetical protein